MLSINYHHSGLDSFTAKKHSHHVYEIFQSLTDGGYFMIGNKLYPLVKGSLYFINVFTLHYANPRTNIEYVRNKIGIHKKYIEKLYSFVGGKDFISDLFEKTIFVQLSKQDADRCDKYFHALLKAKNEEYPDFIMLKTLLSIFDLGLKKVDIFSPPANLYVIKALEYIEKNFNNDIKIEQLAQELFISKFYLCHLFKLHTGITLKTYLIEYRISKAKKLLSETNDRIVDIAINTGFNNCSYFCKTFAALENITPSEYRKGSLSGNTI